MLSLNARTWNVSAYGAESTENDCTRRPATVCFSVNSVALVVIDAWASHPNAGWLRRAKKSLFNLVTLIDEFRRIGRPIFYDPTGLDMDPAVTDGWGDNDHLIAWDQQGEGARILNDQLIENGVTTVFWAGYATNLCLMNKPCGFRSIMPMDWSRIHLLVRDATIALESSETRAEQRLWDAACYEVEYYPNGYTCTVDDVKRALKNA